MEIEFLQRNLARYRVDAGEWTTNWPLTYGSDAPAHFTGISDYPVPDMAGPWILVYREFNHNFDPTSPLTFPGLDEPWIKVNRRVAGRLARALAGSAPLSFPSSHVGT